MSPLLSVEWRKYCYMMDQQFCFVHLMPKGTLRSSGCSPLLGCLPIDVWKGSWSEAATRSNSAQIDIAMCASSRILCYAEASIRLRTPTRISSSASLIIATVVQSWLAEMKAALASHIPINCVFTSPQRFQFPSDALIKKHQTKQISEFTSINLFHEGTPK